MAKTYLLNNQKFDGVINLEVFKIKYIPSSFDLKKYDALIITSKNAIYSLNSFNDDWIKVPCYAIAKKTADIILKNGGIVEYTGSSGHGNDFAKELKDKLANKKVLYVRAKEVASNLVNILKESNTDIDELITYETVCNDKLNIELEKNSTIIFTSPSSVNCFFKNYSWDKSFNAIVIGKTTSKCLPNYVNFKISPVTSVEECIKLSQMVTF
ncbi:uroporphyrinogen-III synthase [Arcobacter arenosus]|uniref:Uroporphyrinogen-III synthase n=1 Tax=Arcobacter arenosus TaxID=2576037 RepID=A0A5R8XXG9_9BACT|nr:uroporphyrinogen-III synthase [Arcobacter arenosus]TLP35859.1 uroporphyrinogen-III synthase [Arcobacter arenosus]